MAGADPPIVAGSPLLGAAPALRRDQLAAYRAALEGHGGDVVRFHLGPPHAGIDFDAVFRPDVARQVLATDAAKYDKQVPAFDEFRWVMGEGLITSEGDRWRRDRRTVAPLFARRRVDGYVATMADAAARVVAQWEPVAASGGEVDVHTTGRHYALDVLGRTVFGEDVEVLAALLADTLPMLSEFAAHRALSPVRLPASWPLPAHRRADRARHALWAEVDRLIAARRAAPEGGDDLLGLLLAARDPETGDALDDQAVRDQALTFLIAGHETTSTTLAFALHLLARHADAQQRVRDEVEAAAPGGRPVAAADLPALAYTAAVVNETLRLYPSGHTIVRRAAEPTEIAGYHEPAGRIVAVSVWGVHHNPEVWPDPYRFDPDRFTVAADEESAAERTRYAHLPFGGGPRGCIGQHLATAELVVAVATLVRAYRLEAGPAEPTLEVGATLRPAGELHCRVQPVGVAGPADG